MAQRPLSSGGFSNDEWENGDINEKGELEDIEEVDDELLPCPVFQIEQNHPDLTQQEIDAIHYIRTVRSQKHTLQQVHVRPPSPFHPIRPLSQRQQQPKHQEEEWWGWRAETLKNWEVVVANLRYLRIEGEEMEEELTPSSMMQQIPRWERLACNSWLTVPRIEQLLAELSERRYGELNGSESKTPYYHMWMYSLLAMHRLLAPYRIFEALGWVNTVLEGEGRERRRGREWGVTIAVVEGGFCQRNLTKLYPKLFEK